MLCCHSLCLANEKLTHEHSTCGEMIVVRALAPPVYRDIWLGLHLGNTFRKRREPAVFFLA